MKVLVDIPDTKQGQDWFKRTKSLSFVQAVKKITVSEADLLAEIAEIKRIHRMAARVDAGQIPTRPLSDLISELSAK